MTLCTSGLGNDHHTQVLTMLLAHATASIAQH